LIDEIEAELHKRMVEAVQTACGNLEDMRMLARDTAKYVERSGIPGTFHAETIGLIERIESLEARISEYAIEVVA
jgi:hypothetical protein